MAHNASFKDVSVATAGSSAQQQSKSGNGFASINAQPGLPMSGSIHGAFASNAQIPGVDMSALAGISPEQLAAIARLFQSGALPLPPQTSSTQTQAPYAPTDDRRDTGSERAILHSQLINSDKEDGELDEGEDTHLSKEQGFLRPPPTGPKRRSRSPHSSQGQSRRQRDSGQSANLPSHASNSFVVTTSSISNVSPRDGLADDPRAPILLNGRSSPETLASRQAASLAFVTELHKAGFLFEQLAREVSKPQLLRRMFELGGLPVSHDMSAPALDEDIYSGSSAAAERKVTMSKRPTPKAALPRDRSEYLAKLQAAKNKKSETLIPATVSDAVLSGTTSPLPIASSPFPAKDKTTGGRPTPVRKLNNKLIRQRLEALRAEQAAKEIAEQASNVQLTSSANKPDARLVPPTSSDAHGINASQGYIPARPTPLATPSSQSAPAKDSTSDHHASNTAVADHGAGVLPGLFMPPNPAKTFSRKRGVASDFYDDVMSSHNSSVQRRPFGWSQHRDANESMIITVSDDEEENGDGDDNNDNDDDDNDDEDDEGDEMDIDSSSDEESSSKERKHIVQPSKSSDASLQHSLPQSTISSAPGTPSTGTPASALARAEQSILDMRKRLADAQKRKAAGKLEPRPAAATQKPSSMAVQTQDGNSQDLARTLASKAEKDRWRRRLEELQQAQLSNGSLAMTTPDAQSSTAVHLSSGTDLSSDKAPASASKQTNNENDAILEVATPGSDSSEVNISVQDEDNFVELSGNVDEDNATHQPTQIERELGGHTISSPALQRETKVGTQAPEDPTTGTNSEDDDDLDDLYGEPNTVPTASRSLTSAQIPVPEALKDTDIDMNSTDGSSIEDDDDDDDLYEPASASLPYQGHDDARTVEQVIEEASGLPSSYEQVPSPPTRELEEAAEESSKPKAYYLAYESPLTKFKDYRYHPDFLKCVSGGFKSLTYSHKIDPDKPLCPYEADGGKCNDKSCEFQHFSEMAMSDNDLLKAIGTEHVPAKGPEEEKKWKSGLALVVKQLRSTNMGQDVQAIARRIAEYRRGFVNDPTRTLYLD